MTFNQDLEFRLPFSNAETDVTFGTIAVTGYITNREKQEIDIIN
jgi:hypothetical protein